jgi:DNA-binding MarR family transcriptional regulator
MSRTIISAIDARLAHDAALMLELYTAGSLVAVLVSEELEKVGVPPQDFAFLGWVTRFQPVTPSQLAAETGLPPTTIRDYVRRLTGRKLLRKEPNLDDGRSYYLVLTAEGQRLSTRGWPAVVAAFARLTEHLDQPAADYLQSVQELRTALRDALAVAARMS